MSSIFKEGPEKAISKLESPDRIKRHDPAVLFTKVVLAKGETVADLGCGTGFFSLPAAQRVGARGLVLAVDKMPEVLEVLEKKLRDKNVKNVKAIKAEVTSTGIGNATVDTLLMANVFHDVDKKASLAENRRILKPTGRLVILDWKKVQTDAGPPLEIRLTQEETMGILRRNGWRVVDHFEIGPSHYVVVAKPTA